MSGARQDTPTTPSPTGTGTAERRGLSEAALWCVHIIGPDDVYAAPDARTAAEWAHRSNTFLMSRLNGVPEDDFVLCFANVELWPYSAEQHAQDLPRSVEQMTPRAALADQSGAR